MNLTNEFSARKSHPDYAKYFKAVKAAQVARVPAADIEADQTACGAVERNSAGNLEVPVDRFAECAALLEARIAPPAPEAEVIRLPSQRADDLQLIRNCYEPVVCQGKAAVAQNWQTAPITPKRIVAMREAYPTATNTGLRTGKLVAVDIDVHDPIHVVQIVALAETMFGDTPLKRFGSKGLLLCYRNDNPIPKVSIVTDSKAKVEILGRGLQFVAFGIHPETKKPFEWRGTDFEDTPLTPLNTSIDMLPEATFETIVEFAKQCADLLRDLGYANPRVREAHSTEKKTRETSVAKDSAINIGRAKEHLKHCVEQGKVAVINHCGNDTIYELACVLMDRFYLSEDKTVELMLDIWYPHCQPNHLLDDCRSIIEHAARYMQNEPGAGAQLASEAFKHIEFAADAPDGAGEKHTCDEPNADGTRYYDGLAYRRVSDIRSEKLEWLWQHRVANGALNMIAGLPAEGKSTVALDLAARITRGGELPFGDGTVEQGAVLIMSAEDHEKQTIKPRLAAAGADMTQVFIVDAMVKEKDRLSKRLLSLASDLDKICNLIEKLKRDGINVKLVIIDPISAYVGEGDGHKNTQMRALLTPLSKSAEKHKFGVVLISHYKKNAEGSNALYRVTDSLAFVASCRGVLLTAKEQDEDGKETGRKLLLNGKPSLIPEGTPGLAYKTESTDVDLDDGSTQNLPRIKWDGFVTVTPDEAMAAAPGGGGQEKLERAVEFLENILADAPAPEKEIHKRAFGQRITRATLRRAKKKLNIVSTREGFGVGQVCRWALVPQEPSEGALKHIGIS